MKQIFSILAIIVFACSSPDPEPPATTPPPIPSSPTTCVRIGAYCKDGTSSTATGSGACSGHGGVSSWKCK